MTIKSQGGIFGRNPEFNDISNVGSATLKNLTTTDSALNISSSAADGSVTINASGNVGVGGSGTNTVTNGLAVNNATAGNYPGYEIQTADTTRFYINASDAASYIVSVGTSPMVFFTNGGEAARFNSSKNLAFPSGQGIDFSATAGTGTSELFSDYETGSFTPVVADAASGGNTGTASQAYGYYTKIGRQVTIHLNMTDIDTTGLTAGNDVYIQGLPFSPLSVTGVISYSGSVWGARINLDASLFHLVPYIQDNLSAIALKEWGDDTGTDDLIVSELISGVADLNISLSYFSA